MEFQTYSAKLVCFGDKIRSGKYRIHSRFERVINFILTGDNNTTSSTNQKVVTSVVKPEIGGGPTNIVMNGVSFNKISSLEIGSNLFKLNNRDTIIPASKIYDSLLESKDVSNKVVERNINTLRNSLLCKAPQKSLVFIHDNDRTSEFQSSFERGYLQRFTAGYEQITRGRIKRGVEMIRGIGYGLTPSGDDFLVGFIAGKYLIQLIYNENTLETRNLICNLSLSDNLISNTYLLMAKEGFFYEKLKKLCISLMKGNENDVELRTTLLVNTGETSGADTLTGFLAAFDGNS